MEFLIEAVLDLIFEGSIEISSNKKVPKWIRYPLIVLIILFCMIVILGLLIIGIVMLKESILAGIITISVSLILFILGIIKFNKIYKEKNTTQNHQ